MAQKSGATGLKVEAMSGIGAKKVLTGIRNFPEKKRFHSDKLRNLLLRHLPMDNSLAHSVNPVHKAVLASFSPTATLPRCRFLS